MTECDSLLESVSTTEMRVIITMMWSAYTETSFPPTGMASFSPNRTPSTGNRAFRHRGDERLELLGTSFIGGWIISEPVNSHVSEGEASRKEHLSGKNVGKWKVVLNHSPAAHGKWTQAFGDPYPAAGETSFGSGPSGWTERLKAQTLKPDCLNSESSSALHLALWPWAVYLSVPQFLNCNTRVRTVLFPQGDHE